MFFSDLSIAEDLTIRYLRRVVWELRTLFAPMPFTPTSVTRMQETGQMLENPLHTVTKSPFLSENSSFKNQFGFLCQIICG